MSEIWSLSALCRCCHAEGHFKALNVPYSYLEELEVYADMLRDTFGILLNAPSIQASYSICDDCITQLRQAARFKKKVTDCEEQFEKYCKNQIIQQIEIKSEKFYDDTPSTINLEYENVYDTKFELDTCGNEIKEEINGKIEIKSESGALNPITIELEPKRVRKAQTSQCRKKIPKTNAQRQQIFRQNQKNIQKSETLDLTLARKRYDAERSKRYRDRLKLKKLRELDTVSSSKEHPLPKVFIANEEKPDQHHKTNCKELTFGQFQMQMNQIQPLMNNEAQQVITTSFQPFQAPYVGHYEYSMPITVTRRETNTFGDGMSENENNEEIFGKIEIKIKSEDGALNPESEIEITKVEKKRRIEFEFDKIQTYTTYTCKYCQKVFKNKHKWECHVNVHEDLSKSCNVCGMICTSKRKLYKHMDAHMRQNVFSSKFICDICNKQLLSKKTLRIHISKMHNGTKIRFICDMCGNSFCERNNLKRHILAVHENLRAFNCTLCPKTFKANKSLQEHIRTHTGEYPYKCDMCGKAFICKRYLTRHKIVHQVNQTQKTINCGAKYHCKVCGETFNNLGEYLKHLRSHSSQQKCTICSKDFTCQFTLRRHMDIHNEIKRFECDICNRKFVEKGTLKRHCENRHNPNKVIKKRESQLSKMPVTNIEKHLQGDTNKPLKCELCPKTYFRRKSLKRHIKEVHIGIKYSCASCSKTYVKRDKLWDHELKAHNIDVRKSMKEGRN